MSYYNFFRVKDSKYFGNLNEKYFLLIVYQKLIFDHVHKKNADNN